MFIKNRYLDQCDADMLLALEERVQRFESAGREGQRPQLADYLPADEIERRAALVELVHVDLECRLKAGENAQVEEYLQQYPELREEQAALKEMRETESRLSRRRPRRLGKFELLEELGSGAFGTVYRARDTSLARIVAVKVSRGSLPSREELDRFLREAHSAAALRHPGIVTVHEAGQSDGSCYLVSELVPGPTLAQRLAGRRPSFRQAAEIMAGVAEALHYAHQQGVIHRDIKPSNILLDADDRPVIMDFGLSRRTSDNTLTVEGQVLGTPAYMPPEQAQGDARRADGRSDVYSLGVVFYELLTGVTPFQGCGERILQRILEEEPLAPRRLDDRIPRDLETICLKALRKEPSGRYQTAAELAEELRRFLRGESIRTRPPGAVGRLARWCRRKPVVAGLLAALLLVALMGFAGISLAWRNAETHLAEARHQKEQAQRNYREARQAVDEIARLGAHPLSGDIHVREVDPIHAELVATALRYYEDFLQRRSDDPSLLLDVARAYRNLGTLYVCNVGNARKAAAAYRKALPLWQKLAQDQPEDISFQYVLAETYYELGKICFRDGHNEEAISLLEQSSAVRTKLLAADAGNVSLLMCLAEIHLSLGSLLGDANHVKVAEQEYQKCFEQLEELVRKEPNSFTHARHLSGVCRQLGVIKCDKGEAVAGERFLQKERTLAAKLLKDAPDRRDLQDQLASNLFHIARAQDRSQRPDAALASFRADALLWEELLAKRPNDDIHQGTLAACYHKIGILEWQTGHPDKAVAPLQKALQSREKLCQLYPESPSRLSDLSGTCYRLGEVLEALKRFSEAEVAYQQALVHEQNLSVQQPGKAEIQKHLRERKEALARVGRAQGRTANLDAQTTATPR